MNYFRLEIQGIFIRQHAKVPFASRRHFIDLSDNIQGLVVVLPGQSGEENLSHSRWSADAKNHLSAHFCPIVRQDKRKNKEKSFLSIAFSAV